MDCPFCKCENGFDDSFLEEIIPCKNCNCKNRMTYHACPNCKLMWRSLNGEIMKDSIANLGEMVEGVGIVEIPEDQLSFFDGLKEDLVKHARAAVGDATMSDFVHRCLHCNSIAFPCGDSSYRCDLCGFEWEVIPFGK